MKGLIKILILIIVLNSCTEPYVPETITFEKALVVESTITDEYRHQQVKLSRVVILESANFNTENNAQVWIDDSNANNYTFTANDLGVYISDIKFKGLPQTTYKLHIKTQTGNEYISKPTLLTSQANITNVYAEKITKAGETGVQIYIDNENNNDAKYFRYEFKETYKIVTPFNITKKLIITNAHDVTKCGYGWDSCRYVSNVVPIGDDYSSICYISDIQKRIIQTSIGNSTKKNIIKFPVRFINKDSSLIRTRYSINVKQYTQSFNSYNYYKILNSLGSVESLLSETQTGFVQGNITSNKKEKIVGFFDVSSVSEKRVFFNYQDFNFEKPKYPYKTIIETLDYALNSCPSSGGGILTRPERIILYEAIKETDPPYELLDFEYGEIGEIGTFNPRYFTIVNPECSNCTTFASKEKPEFWID